MGLINNLSSLNPNPVLNLKDVACLVAQGDAVLIDVREPDEWAETGVASCAVTLPLSELLNGPSEAWTQCLEENRDAELYLYCAAGRRSERAASLLLQQGYKATNAGSLKDWDEAGLPIRRWTRS